MTSFREHTEGVDPALTHGALVFGVVGLVVGLTMVLQPSGFTSPAWAGPKGMAPIWVWGAAKAMAGAVVLAAVWWRRLPHGVLFWGLLATAALKILLVAQFAAYAFAHHGVGAYGAENVGALALLVYIVARRVGRL